MLPYSENFEFSVNRTDSMSALLTIDAVDPVYPLVRRIRLLLETLNSSNKIVKSRNKRVELFWMPGRTGIARNKVEDQTAKSAGHKSAVDVQNNQSSL